MRHLFILVISIFSGFIAFSQTYNQDVANIINQVDFNSLVFYMRNLSGEDPVVVNGATTTIEHRVSNWGNDLAADYIVETLEGFGLTPIIDEYNPPLGKNIIAVQPGVVYPDEYIMICAHYDSVDYYCADDNASGTTAVIEAARIMSGIDFEYSIIYALWDEEELGLIGSEHYANEAANNGDVIHAVINLDMIAWDGDNDTVAELHSENVANSVAFTNFIATVNGLYNIQLVPFIIIPGTSNSDQRSFLDHGFTCSLIGEERNGDFNPYYHTENDRIDILNLPYFHEMVKLSIGVIAQKAEPIDTSGIQDTVEQLTGVQITNYPNPFHGETNISYTLEKESFIRISLMNSLGQDIKVLAEGVRQTGDYQYRLQAENLASGIYFLHLQTPKTTSVNKLIID